MDSPNLQNEVEQEQSPFHFVGNSLWLDFVNTQAMQEGSPVDLISEYVALMRWPRAAGVLTDAEEPSLRDRWDSVSESVLAEAHDFRRILRDLAGNLAAGQPANAREIDAINERLARGNTYGQVQFAPPGYRLKQVFEWNQPGDLLTPVAQSAADLLTGGDATLVRKCESPTCILFFYDTTKNHARRWCSMTGCGNRHKQATHRARRGDILSGVDKVVS